MTNEEIEKHEAFAKMSIKHGTELGELRLKLQHAESRIEQLINQIGAAYGTGYRRGIEFARLNKDQK